MKMTIGANIKHLRNSKNITQEQLAEVMNISCAAVSKWERGETLPDITLLQPLAHYFNVTIDELMGYNQEKVQQEIQETIERYKQALTQSLTQAHEIITNAYQEYPNDYRIMHYYMWNLAGDKADNDPAKLLAHKDEFIKICDKISEGCAEETIRLDALNMQAKLLHAEGKTNEALTIYQSKFPHWYQTGNQKAEQLFEKNTEEHFYYLQKNMYELANMVGDKLGKTLFFHPSFSTEEKTSNAVKYGDLLTDIFKKTNEPVFLVLVNALLGRMENDLVHRDGKDEDIVEIMEKHFQMIQLIDQQMKTNYPLYDALAPSDENFSLLGWNINYRLNATEGRRAVLLKNPAYMKVINQYK